MRALFDKALVDLKERTLLLGGRVQTGILLAPQSLEQGDRALATQLIQMDASVNEQRLAIRQDCLRLIAQQQPAAGDLRRIETMIELADELERIHDHVKGFALLSLRAEAETTLPEVMRLIEAMARRAFDMLARALQAFADGDAAQATGIEAMDEEVDALYEQVYREVMQYMATHSVGIEGVNDLQWAARNLERIADRVSNICEWVVYDATGQYLELDTEQEAPPRIE
jgi:phosphate transport system protein